MFTEFDAYNAIVALAKLKGNPRAALVERMMRAETDHFRSLQYKQTGTGGMEKGKWKSIPPNATNGFVKMRDNQDNRLVDFIVWKSVTQFVRYLSDYIDRYNGNWTRWNAIRPNANYIRLVRGIKNRWIIDENWDSTKYNDTNYNAVNAIGNNKSTVENWMLNVGEALVAEELGEEQAEKIEKYITKISEVEKRDAAGIWQIIKLVADQYSLSQNINDATIAFSQGSLLNFVRNVVQEPWLQFWGDTVGDQYFFHCRKEPFDAVGYTGLPTMRSIQENEVFSDDLGWYNGPIYSWYQIIPRGSFLGEQNLIFAYVKAVFFEEYAEVWGSKPNIQVSNYVNFNKLDENNKMFSKALADLKYMVESNAYLPFTRQGTIVIAGDNTIKIGYKIYYESTGELFYVNGVSHSYVSTEDGPEYRTVLRVSRGVLRAQLDRYFKLINFDNPPPIKQEYDATIKEKPLVFYFDNGRSYLIDINEDFSQSESGTDIKMVNQITEFPDLRNDLYNMNQKTITAAVELVHKHKGQTFVAYGSMDEDAKDTYSYLAKKRSETVKKLVITEYLKRYSDLTEEQLSETIRAASDKDTDRPYIINENENLSVFDDGIEGVSLKEKAYKRNAAFYLKDYQKKATKDVEQKGVAWSVNRENFYYFMNRKQMMTDVRK